MLSEALKIYVQNSLKVIGFVKLEYEKISYSLFPYLPSSLNKGLRYFSYIETAVLSFTVILFFIIRENEYIHIHL